MTDEIKKKIRELLSHKASPKKTQQDFEKLKSKQFSLSPQEFTTKFTTIKKIWEESAYSVPQSYYLFDLLITELSRYKESWIVKGNRIFIPTESYCNKLIKLCEIENEKSLETNPFVPLHIGALHHCLGEYDKSRQQLAKAAAYENLKKVVFDYKRACLTIKTIDMIKLLHQKEILQMPAISWEIQNTNNNANYVFSYYCDEIYFLALYNIIIDSIQNKPKKSPFYLHFHIINITQKSKKIIKEINKKLSNSNIYLQISSEQTTVSERTYYTISRFVLIEYMLKHFNKNIFIFDADSQLLQSPENIIAKFGNKDIAGYVSAGPYGEYPWRGFWAGFVYFANNSNGKLFAQIVRKTINYLWKTNGDNWWIDQTALYISREITCNLCKDFAFQNTGPSCYEYIKSNQELKLKGFKSIPEYKKLVSSGKTWNEAIRELQSLEK